MRIKNYIKFICFFLISFSIVSADSASDLQSKISQRQAQINQLQLEINQYNNELNKAGTQAKTLTNTLKTLDLTSKKISQDINLTMTKISKTNLTIDETSSEIDKTQKQIDLNKQAISSAFRNTKSLEDIGLLSMVLANRNISDLWKQIDNGEQVRNVITQKSKELNSLEDDLSSKQASLQSQKKDLVNLNQDLNGKKQAVLATAQEKSTLLAQTKDKEENYKKILASKQEEEVQYEKELYDFESQLNFTIDKSSYPAPKNGILAWPLDNIFITQLFGKTVGADKLYVSGSHNGVDFRASVGTRVKNVLDGVVTATGNTDIYKGCYSWGKWVLVKHDNGLSTIYGHLSVIGVTPGQFLKTGDLIGYSGNTGYTTGPHLHVTVYATQGVRVEQFVNSMHCKQAVIPIAPIQGYLDPMVYFPTL